MYNKYKQRFAIKKFTVGVASVFIGGTALMETDILPFQHTNVILANSDSTVSNVEDISLRVDSFNTKDYMANGINEIYKANIQTTETANYESVDLEVEYTGPISINIASPIEGKYANISENKGVISLGAVTGGTQYVVPILSKYNDDTDTNTPSKIVVRLRDKVTNTILKEETINQINKSTPIVGLKVDTENINFKAGYYNTTTNKVGPTNFVKYNEYFNYRMPKFEVTKVLEDNSLPTNGDKIKATIEEGAEFYSLIQKDNVYYIEAKDIERYNTETARIKVEVVNKNGESKNIVKNVVFTPVWETGSASTTYIEDTNAEFSLMTNKEKVKYLNSGAFYYGAGTKVILPSATSLKIEKSSVKDVNTVKYTHGKYKPTEISTRINGINNPINSKLSLNFKVRDIDKNTEYIKLWYKTADSDEKKYFYNDKTLIELLKERNTDFKAIDKERNYILSKLGNLSKEDLIEYLKKEEISIEWEKTVNLPIVEFGYDFVENTEISGSDKYFWNKSNYTDSQLNNNPFKDLPVSEIDLYIFLDPTTNTNLEYTTINKIIYNNGEIVKNEQNHNIESSPDKEVFGNISGISELKNNPVNIDDNITLKTNIEKSAFYNWKNYSGAREDFVVKEDFKLFVEKTNTLDNNINYLKKTTTTIGNKKYNVYTTFANYSELDGLFSHKYINFDVLSNIVKDGVLKNGAYETEEAEILLQIPKKIEEYLKESPNWVKVEELSTSTITMYRYNERVKAKVVIPESFNLRDKIILNDNDTAIKNKNDIITISSNANNYTNSDINGVEVIQVIPKTNIKTEFVELEPKDGWTIYYSVDKNLSSLNNLNWQTNQPEDKSKVTAIKWVSSTLSSKSSTPLNIKVKIVDSNYTTVANLYTNSKFKLSQSTSYTSSKRDSIEVSPVEKRANIKFYVDVDNDSNYSDEDLLLTPKNKDIEVDLLWYNFTKSKDSNLYTVKGDAAIGVTSSLTIIGKNLIKDIKNNFENQDAFNYLNTHGIEAIVSEVVEPSVDGADLDLIIYFKPYEEFNKNIIYYDSLTGATVKETSINRVEDLAIEKDFSINSVNWKIDEDAGKNAPGGDYKNSLKSLVEKVVIGDKAVFNIVEEEIYNNNSIYIPVTTKRGGAVNIKLVLQNTKEELKTINFIPAETKPVDTNVNIDDTLAENTITINDKTYRRITPVNSSLSINVPEKNKVANVEFEYELVRGAVYGVFKAENGNNIIKDKVTIIEGGQPENTNIDYNAPATITDDNGKVWELVSPIGTAHYTNRDSATEHILTYKEAKRNVKVKYVSNKGTLLKEVVVKQDVPVGKDVTFTPEGELSLPEYPNTIFIDVDFEDTGVMDPITHRVNVDENANIITVRLTENKEQRITVAIVDADTGTPIEGIRQIDMYGNDAIVYEHRIVEELNRLGYEVVENNAPNRLTFSYNAPDVNYRVTARKVTPKKDITVKYVTDTGLDIKEEVIFREKPVGENYTYTLPEEFPSETNPNKKFVRVTDANINGTVSNENNVINAVYRIVDIPIENKIKISVNAYIADYSGLTTDEFHITVNGNIEENVPLDLSEIIEKYKEKGYVLKGDKPETHRIDSGYKTTEKEYHIEFVENKVIRTGEVYIHFVDSNTGEELSGLTTMKMTGDLYDSEAIHRESLENKVRNLGLVFVSLDVPSSVVFEEEPKHYYVKAKAPVPSSITIKFVDYKTNRPISKVKDISYEINNDYTEEFTESRITTPLTPLGYEVVEHNIPATLTYSEQPAVYYVKVNTAPTSTLTVKYVDYNTNQPIEGLRDVVHTTRPRFTEDIFKDSLYNSVTELGYEVVEDNVPSYITYTKEPKVYYIKVNTVVSEINNTINVEFVNENGEVVHRGSRNISGKPNDYLKVDLSDLYGDITLTNAGYVAKDLKDTTLEYTINKTNTEITHRVNVVKKNVTNVINITLEGIHEHINFGSGPETKEITVTGKFGESIVLNDLPELRKLFNLSKNDRFTKDKTIHTFNHLSNDKTYKIKYIVGDTDESEITMRNHIVFIDKDTGEEVFSDEIVKGNIENISEYYTKDLYKAKLHSLGYIIDKTSEVTKTNKYIGNNHYEVKVSKSNLLRNNILTFNVKLYDNTEFDEETEVEETLIVYGEIDKEVDIDLSHIISKYVAKGYKLYEADKLKIPTKHIISIIEGKKYEIKLYNPKYKDVGTIIIHYVDYKTKQPIANMPDNVFKGELYETDYIGIGFFSEKALELNYKVVDAPFYNEVSGFIPNETVHKYVYVNTTPEKRVIKNTINIKYVTESGEEVYRDKVSVYGENGEKVNVNLTAYSSKINRNKYVIKNEEFFKTHTISSSDTDTTITYTLADAVLQNTLAIKVSLNNSREHTFKEVTEYVTLKGKMGETIPLDLSAIIDKYKEKGYHTVISNVPTDHTISDKYLKKYAVYSIALDTYKYIPYGDGTTNNNNNRRKSIPIVIEIKTQDNDEPIKISRIKDSLTGFVNTVETIDLMPYINKFIEQGYRITNLDTQPVNTTVTFKEHYGFISNVFFVNMERNTKTDSVIHYVDKNGNSIQALNDEKLENTAYGYGLFTDETIGNKVDKLGYKKETKVVYTHSDGRIKHYNVVLTPKDKVLRIQNMYRNWQIDYTPKLNEKGEILFDDTFISDITRELYKINHTLSYSIPKIKGSKYEGDKEIINVDIQSQPITHLVKKPIKQGDLVSSKYPGYTSPIDIPEEWFNKTEDRVIDISSSDDKLDRKIVDKIKIVPNLIVDFSTGEHSWNSSEITEAPEDYIAPEVPGYYIASYSSTKITREDLEKGLRKIYVSYIKYGKYVITHPDGSIQEISFPTNEVKLPVVSGYVLDKNVPVKDGYYILEATDKSRFVEEYKYIKDKPQKVKVNFINSATKQPMRDSLIIHGSVGKAITDYFEFNKLNIVYDKSKYSYIDYNDSNLNHIITKSDKDIYEYDVLLTTVAKNSGVDEDLDNPEYEREVGTLTAEGVDPIAIDLDDEDDDSAGIVDRGEPEKEAPIPGPIEPDSDADGFTDDEVFGPAPDPIEPDSDADGFTDETAEEIKKELNKVTVIPNNERTTITTPEELNKRDLTGYIPYAAGGVAITGTAVSGLYLLRRRGIM